MHNTVSKDIAFVLHHLAADDPRFTPSLALLDRSVNDHAFARRIFRHYQTVAYDPTNYAQRALVERVRNDPFHLLSDKEHRKRHEYYRQLGFRLAFCRTALAQVTSDATLLANFSSPDASFAVDYRDFVTKGKIVLLRFKATQGRAAILLAKVLKEKFYRDVYRLLDDGIPPEKPFFFVADEFQDVIAVDQDNAFDDFSWFSKAREFGCVNIVATQALSSLHGHAQKDLVNALVSNCSTKIFMQNDDPAADSFVRNFIGVERALSQLGNSEALVSRFGLNDRRQRVAHLHCAQAFTRTQKALARATRPKRERSNGAGTVKRMEEIDALLFSSALKAAYRNTPHYLEVINEFHDILTEDKTSLDYPEAMQDVVMEVLCEYRRRFLKESPLAADQRIAGVGWIDGRWLYLDLPTPTPQENEQFQRDVLGL